MYRTRKFLTKENLPIFIFVILLTYLWWPALWMYKVPVHTDSSSLFIPLLSYLSSAFAGVDSIFWASNLYGGHPLFAEGQSGALNPLNILASIYFTPEYAFGFLIYANMLLAGIGVYCLSRVFNIGKTSSAMSCLIVVFSGAWLHNTHNLAIISTLAWVPWQFVAVERWLKVPSLYNGSLLAIPASLMVYSGYPAITYGVAIYISCYLILCLFIRDPEVSKDFRARAYFVSGVAAIILTCMLSAVQLVSLLELAGQSHRAGGINLPFGGLTSIFQYIGGLFGTDPIDGVARISLSLSSAIGTIALLWYFFMKKSPGITRHFIASFILFNLGIEYASPLFRIVYDHGLIPGLHSFRIMNPFLTITIVGLSLVIAYTVHMIGAARPWEPLIIKNKLVFAAALLISGFVLLMLFGLWRGEVIFSLKLSIFLIIGLPLLTILNVERFVPAVAIFLLIIEILLLKMHPFIFYESDILKQPEIISVIRAQDAESNYKAKMAAPGMEMVLMSGSNPEVGEAFSRFSRVLPPYIGLRWGIPSIDGGMALPLARRVEAGLIIDNELVSSVRDEASSRLIDRLGVKYVSSDHTIDLPGFSLLGIDNNFGVKYFTNEFAVPRFKIYYKSKFVSSFDQVKYELPRTPSDCLIIEDSLRSSPASEDCIDVGEHASPDIDVVEKSSTSYLINVDLKSDAWLYIADANYPGWRAKVNDNNTTVYSADLLGKAIPLKSGYNSVRLYFEPSYFRFSLALSILGVFLVFLLGFRRFFNRN